MFLFVGLGTVGFLDDYIKISAQRSLGLRSRAKFVGQTFVAVVFGVLAISPALEDSRPRPRPAHAHLVHPRPPLTSACRSVLVLFIWLLIAGRATR